ncbi:MAG: SAM-dependent chlorinase/fluorinase [Gammaproteobacteria bacterium]|nr:SAM-dependent chlorinase/fluorinase [Gammaproteobacteria bacterium]
MIVLFTDFGSDGPYVGQMKAVLAQQVPETPVIDLLHNAPRFNAQASAHLLAAYISTFPADSVVLGVVDPGVGDEQRKAIAINIAGRWYVGPANGLFDVLAARAMMAQHDVTCWEITWRPENLSNSFHGRDLFAPVAARLARGEMPPGVQIDWPVSVATARASDLFELIFIDHYGNAITGIRAANMDSAACLRTGDRIILRANTFSDVAVGQAFCYENANGLMEIAINQGNAAHGLGLSVGTRVATHG